MARTSAQPEAPCAAWIAAGDAEMHQIAEGALHLGFDIDDMVLSVLGDDGRNFPVRLDDHAGIAVLRHAPHADISLNIGFGASANAGEDAMACGGAHPLAGVTHSVYRIIGDDALQSLYVAIAIRP